MKRKLMIDFDSDRKQSMMIGADEPGNIWDDLAVLMEAIGCLAAIDRKTGHIEHNGKPVTKHLHEYLDKVLKDYEKSYEADKRPDQSLNS